MTTLILSCGGIGVQRSLTRGRLTLGRADDNNWVLLDTDPEQTVSRHHCVFEAVADGFTVTDLDSTNGTWLNDRRLPKLEATRLANGDVLDIGRYILTSALQPEPVARLKTEKLPDLDELDKLFGQIAPGPAPAQPSGEPQPQSPDDVLARLLGSVELPSPERGSRDRSEPPSRMDIAINEAWPSARPEPPPPATPVASASEGSWQGTDGQRMLAAFLRGADLPADTLAGDLAKENMAEETLEQAGAVFARMAIGLRELLAARDRVKMEAELKRTLLVASGNNPIKFSAEDTEVVLCLLKRRGAGYLSPLDAVDMAFQDLVAHELGMLKGLEAAVDELLATFDPVKLEARLQSIGTMSLLLQGGRKAKLWEIYRERYVEIARQARRRFLGDQGVAFKDAYSNQAAAGRSNAGGPNA
ncbi:type VI secretion system protein ImpI [Skermanella aerolata]|uniref:type VI secretion system-associated FHA domain protein TagH n=1 Tax=Skermanella aerolata TaxID=393310 RepID=UPI003D21A3D7